MNKQLRAKTTEELCTLIMRLKLQLLETRFRVASGDTEKVKNMQDVRKTIARALTILNERQIDLSIGTHGIIIYDRKNNTTKAITNVVSDALNAASKDSKSAETIKEGIVEGTVSASAKTEDNKNQPKTVTTPIVKKELKSQMNKKAEKQVIHKTVGGGA